MVRLQKFGQTRVAVIAHQIEQLCRRGTFLRLLQLAQTLFDRARKEVSRQLLATGAEALHEAHTEVRPRNQARVIEARLKATEFKRAIVAHVHQIEGDLYSTERARDGERAGQATRQRWREMTAGGDDLRCGRQWRTKRPNKRAGESSPKPKRRYARSASDACLPGQEFESELISQPQVRNLPHARGCGLESN